MKIDDNNDRNNNNNNHWVCHVNRRMSCQSPEKVLFQQRYRNVFCWNCFVCAIWWLHQFSGNAYGASIFCCIRTICFIKNIPAVILSTFLPFCLRCRHFLILNVNPIQLMQIRKSCSLFKKLTGMCKNCTMKINWAKRQLLMLFYNKNPNLVL